jgi:hypothetical protein
MSIFSGTTEECMRHFAKRLGRNYPRRNAICRLLGINQETGREWFAKIKLPIGEHLLKLRCLLSTLGYGVQELEILPPDVRVCAETLGFRVVSLDALVDSLKRNRGTVLSILIRNDGTSKEVRTAMRSMAAIAAGDLLRAKEHWAKQLGRRPEIASPAEVQPVREDKTGIQENQISGDQEQDLSSLAHLILAALPIAERVLSDNFSVEARQKLRHLTPTQRGRSNGVFDLYQALSGLCGERARNHHISSQQQQ